MRPLELRIQPIRIRQCLRINQNHRVQMRRLVIGLHPLDISLNQLPASHLPRSNRRLRLGNRRLPYIERGLLRRSTSRELHAQHKLNQQNHKDETAQNSSRHRSSFTCERAQDTNLMLPRYYTHPATRSEQSTHLSCKLKLKVNFSIFKFIKFNLSIQL